jgi:hypothetical protein
LKELGITYQNALRIYNKIMALGPEIIGLETMVKGRTRLVRLSAPITEDKLNQLAARKGCLGVNKNRKARIDEERQAYIDEDTLAFIQTYLLPMAKTGKTQEQKRLYSIYRYADSLFPDLPPNDPAISKAFHSELKKYREWIMEIGETDMAA